MLRQSLAQGVDVALRSIDVQRTKLYVMYLNKTAGGL
jgi:hypothetical protein